MFCSSLPYVCVTVRGRGGERRWEARCEKKRKGEVGAGCVSDRRKKEEEEEKRKGGEKRGAVGWGERKKKRRREECAREGERRMCG